MQASYLQAGAVQHSVPSGASAASRYSRRTAIAAGTLALALTAGQWCRADSAPSDDRREIFSASSPAWLRAVGKLQVPGSRYDSGRRDHLLEDCSATLVTSSAGHSADTIVTAWHCLADYNDLSKPITFTLLPGQPGAEQRQAYRLDDGGGMEADWAVLRLYRPIATHEVRALAIHPERAEAGRNISMAGYSRDPGKGAGGERLTFDRNCRITDAAAAVGHSDCIAYKGASGGAVVQFSKDGLPLFSGVISQGNGAGVSTFVPVASFRSALVRHLQ